MPWLKTVEEIFLILKQRLNKGCFEGIFGNVIPGDKCEDKEWTVSERKPIQDAPLSWLLLLVTGTLFQGSLGRDLGNVSHNYLPRVQKGEIFIHRFPPPSVKGGSTDIDSSAFPDCISECWVGPGGISCHLQRSPRAGSKSRSWGEALLGCICAKLIKVITAMTGGRGGARGEEIMLERCVQYSYSYTHSFCFLGVGRLALS